MKEENKMFFICHPSCIYRRLIRGRGLICTSPDFYNDKIVKISGKYPEYCPLPLDYYNHMDVYYAELRTERGLLRLRIITAEPELVAPAFREYMKWLHCRRRNVYAAKSPVNEYELKEYVDRHVLTDAIYAEFIIPEETTKRIREKSKAEYPAFESTLPDKIRSASENFRKTMEKRWAFIRSLPNDRSSYTAKQTEMLRTTLIDWNNAETELTRALHEEKKSISRDDWLRIRNYFWGWE